MNQGNEKLSKDYEALQEMLTRYPGITIVSTEKDPPEQYVLEYRLFGYGYDANGEVQMLRRHRVQISLPFGYPHFPPTVKPLTKICHPDVAEHAVRIAAYWQSNQSLADLVVHIGDMIRGAVFNTEGAFNQEAAEWYEANRQKLPLAELEYHDPNRRPAAEKGGVEIPYKRLAIFLAVGLVVAGGGLFVRDKWIISKSGKQLQQMKDVIENRQFKDADDIGRKAVDALNGVLFLRGSGKERKTELAAILESATMREGLQGRIEHQGRYVPMQEADTLRELELQEQTAVEKLAAGDLEGAIGIFTAAVQLAEKKGMSEAADGVRRFSAERRLTYYVDKGNASYSEQRWQGAVDEYGRAVDILRNESAYLSAASLATLEKLEKLKTLSIANVYKQEALQAEKAAKFDQAGEQYKAIAAMIRRSPYSQDPLLLKVAVEAEQEGARLGEQALIASGTSYLLENYKEIFARHYPGLNETALQSPRVRYLGRIDGKMVFIISCIELIQRHSNEFRLQYQYDPKTDDWSLYRE